MAARRSDEVRAVHREPRRPAHLLSRRQLSRRRALRALRRTAGIAHPARSAPHRSARNPWARVGRLGFSWWTASQRRWNLAGRSEPPSIRDVLTRGLTGDGTERPLAGR